MRKPSAPSRPGEVRGIKPEVLELAVGTPLAAAVSPPDASSSDEVQTRLKFVQVGLWEARRRWLTGQTRDLDKILAHLDEDLELLGRTLAGEPTPAQPVELV
jgi:hypothetical protein